MGDPTGTDLEEAARDRAQLDLDHALAALPSDTVATGQVVTGAPAQVLEEAGERLDLLVVGSRSYGPVLRVLLGSVSGHLATASPCPLVVTPRSATPRAEDEHEASPADAS